MRSLYSLALSLCLALGPAIPAAAQTVLGAPIPVPPRPEMQSRTAQPLLTASARASIARDLIAKWQSAANRRPGGGGARWARILAKAVASADAQNVLNATNARSLDELHVALTGGDISSPVAAATATPKLGNGGVAPQTLGSYSDDLVYTPLPYGRCRIADSRNIGSPIAALETRNLYIEDVANYSSQGGNGTYSSGASSTNCGVLALTPAYALSITLLSPGGPGTFKVFPYGAAYQTGNTIIMNAGTFGASADLIVRSCWGCAYEISIFSGARVDYVIDVIGYYMPPMGTPLSCYTTSGTTHTASPGNWMDLGAPACQSGFTAIETICDTSTTSVYLLRTGGGRCAAINRGVGDASLTGSQKCCRIPGR